MERISETPSIGPIVGNPHTGRVVGTSNDASTRNNLLADCSRCFGLCCVALPFTASADFAITKAAGEPCRHLAPDFGCGIHSSLRDRGFPGCTVYDCFGAGQRVAQFTYAGRNWREAPESAAQMFAVFPVVRQLHELLWYLEEAIERSSDGLRTRAVALRAATAALADRPADQLLEVDVPAHRERVNEVLLEISVLVRSATGRKQKNRRGADLVGARLRGADLRGANLRGAYLIGADLRSADLRDADLIGADLRGADLRQADLSTALFLTQFQVNAARGNSGTSIPPTLTRPSQWPASQ